MAKKNNNKNDIFDLRIFPNGRVYFLDRDLLDEAIKQGKEILLCCNAWSGGYSIAIGANLEKYPVNGDDDWQDVYMMYSYDIGSKVFTPEDLEKFYRVIFTSGEMIYMNTGSQATFYQGSMFIDWESSDANIIERQEIWTFPEKFNGGAMAIEKLRKEVNSEMTKNNFARTENGEKKIRTLQAYGIVDKEKWR